MKAYLRALLLNDWMHRASVVLTGVFLLQFVLWFNKEDGWLLPETVSIIQWTLFVIGAIEMFPRLHGGLRGLLHLTAVLTISVNVLEQYLVVPNMPISSFFSARLLINLIWLQPYIWFALGTWLIYLAAIWTMRVKWRVYTVLILTVITFSVRDSFSLIYLWPQAAIVSGTGLLLIIRCHFEQIKRRDPSAYEHLSDYPAAIMLPVIILIGSAVTVGTLMPEVGPTLTDPYSAWRAAKGEALPFTTAKGIDVDVFKGDASSGYSRDDSSLGGAFQFDHTPVMTVDTTHRSYWRGESLEIYTGAGWEKLEADSGDQIVPVWPGRALPSSPEQQLSKLDKLEVRQTVTMLREERFPVLFSSFEPSIVEQVNQNRSEYSGVSWVTRKSELRYIRRQPISSYTVVSQMPIINEAVLRESTAEEKPGWLAPYLQLPNELPARVRQLAEELTQGAAQPYVKAELIEDFLKTNFAYTNTPNDSKGVSADFVDRFLFEVKEGYCDYFSSAMVVMARSIGLPARWVKGYATGTHELSGGGALGFGESLEELLDENGSGTYTVLNSDAHSWVEVYIAGYGWVPFEPTAGFTLPAVTVQEEPVLEPVAAPAAEASQETASNGWFQTGHAVSLAAAALIVIAAVYVLRRVQLSELWSGIGRRRKAVHPSHKIIVECERLLRSFKRRGFVREEHETLREAVLRWGKEAAAMKQELSQLLLLFEKAKYSKQEVSADEYQQAITIVHSLRKQLKSI